jgi:hypothetical protein
MQSSGVPDARPLAHLQTSKGRHSRGKATLHVPAAEGPRCAEWVSGSSLSPPSPRLPLTEKRTATKNSALSGSPIMRRRSSLAPQSSRMNRGNLRINPGVQSRDVIWIAARENTGMERHTR